MTTKTTRKAAAKTTKVLPVPRRFRALTPHITTADVGAAIALYEAAFGAEAVTVETAPGSDVVLFAQVKIGNSMLTIGQGEAFGPGFVSLHHYVEDADATWAKAQAAGFAELQALSVTYWGDKMGLLADPLGVRWSIGQRVERLSTDERSARAAQAMGAPVATTPVMAVEPVAADLAPEQMVAQPIAPAFALLH